MVGKSSTSEAVAEHVNSPILLVPLAEILAVTVGSVFSTVTEAVEVTAIPWSSVAVSVQLTSSPGEVFDWLKVKVEVVLA